jgi:hypothetical protein
MGQCRYVLCDNFRLTSQWLTGARHRDVYGCAFAPLHFPLLDNFRFKISCCVDDKRRRAALDQYCSGNGTSKFRVALQLL